MELTKQKLNEPIDNGIQIRDQIIASDVENELAFVDRLEREQKLARLINIAEALIRGEKVEVE